jgi:DNA (cytosine-5)-methyltransferase 1
MRISFLRCEQNREQMIRVFEGFAGYGGASFGLKRAGISHSVVGFSEIDTWANEIFRLNHPHIQDFGDITLIDETSMPDFDLFTGGFPCQPFSSAGLGNGENDTRGTLFHDILRICSKKKPEHILLENVKGLLSIRHQGTLRTIIHSLEEIGYKVAYKLLNTKDYGIPQNRERVWIYATLDAAIAPGEIFELPKIPAPHIMDFLDENPDLMLYKNLDQIKRLEEVTGVELITEEHLCFDVYNRKIKTDGTCITITEPHHNSMRIIEPRTGNKPWVRKLSVQEHFRLMGFRDGEFDFGNFSYQQLCKRAGNGWDINLVSLLFQNMFKSQLVKEESWVKCVDSVEHV